MVGGAPMYPSKNIIQNAVNSKDHTTLVAAVKAAGLVDTLESPGPVHGVRADQRGLRKLPAGTVDTLLKPENKAELTNVLTYHVVPGRLTAKDLMAKIKEGGGKAMLKTVEGEDLTFEMKDGKLWVIDAKGDKAQVTIPQRDAVERRHPRDRHRAAAGLIETISRECPPHRRGGPTFNKEGHDRRNSACRTPCAT